MIEAIKVARNFREYKVWQDAVEYTSKVYAVTSEMPYFEKKGLCDQLQRAAVSIASNITEGAAQLGDVNFARFLDIALGSTYEVETQLLIAKNVEYLSEQRYDSLLVDLQLIEKQLSTFINCIRIHKNNSSKVYRSSRLSLRIVV